MGMYDQLNNITRAINESKKTEELKTTKATVEQLTKYNILSVLQEEIKEAEQNGFNLYHEATQDKRYNELKFLHNRDFTTYFIKDNYFKEISKFHKIQKQLNKTAIENEKATIKEQKEQEKIKKRQTKQKIETIRSIAKGFILICTLLLAPIVIIGGFLLACTKAVK